MVTKFFQQEAQDPWQDENPNKDPGPGGGDNPNVIDDKELEPPFGEWGGWADNVDWGAAGTAFTALCVTGLIAGAIYLSVKKSGNMRGLNMGGAH